jgi:hypothetical protein
MEDYELVAILRKRAALLLPKMSSRLEKEELTIISEEPTSFVPSKLYCT